ncbi:MAG: hypothetical protein WD749_00630 [Phycisphaerales bacterium]
MAIRMRARRGALLAVIAAASLAGGCADDWSYRAGYGDWGHCDGPRHGGRIEGGWEVLAFYGVVLAGAAVISLGINAAEAIRDRFQDGPPPSPAIAWDSAEGQRLRAPLRPLPPRLGVPPADSPPGAAGTPEAARASPAGP